MLQPHTSRTELSSLGEFGLIKHLAEKVELKNKGSVVGIGDDAAVIDPSPSAGSGRQMNQVVTSDMLTEGIHFDLSYAPLKHLGYKAIVVNLSDIYAMNAEAKQVLVSIAISNRFSVEAIDELYDGMLTACSIYGVDLVGGDTCASTSGLTISVTTIGAVEPDKHILRSGAKDKELLVVSGDLGGAYMGLQLLEREKAVFKDNDQIQPDLDGHDYILERQLKPEARKDVIAMFKELELRPTSMIDISDGLASEAIHLATSSGTGVRIYEEKIPIDPTVINTARDFQLDPTTVALSGGEDYELLFTIQQDDFDKIKGSPHFTVIGHMCDKSEGMHLIDKQGAAHELTAQGWDAFLRGSGDE